LGVIKNIPQRLNVQSEQISKLQSHNIKKINSKQILKENKIQYNPSIDSKLVKSNFLILGVTNLFQFIILIIFLNQWNRTLFGGQTPARTSFDIQVVFLMLLIDLFINLYVFSRFSFLVRSKTQYWLSCTGFTICSLNNRILLSTYHSVASDLDILLILGDFLPGTLFMSSILFLLIFHQIKKSINCDVWPKGYASMMVAINLASLSLLTDFEGPVFFYGALIKIISPLIWAILFFKVWRLDFSKAVLSNQTDFPRLQKLADILSIVIFIAFIGLIVGVVRTITTDGYYYYYYYVEVLFNLIWGSVIIYMIAWIITAITLPDENSN